MSKQKKQEEFAFNRMYSRFKLQLFFNQRQPITHYGQERYHCTVAQIDFGHINQVTLERQKGFDDCIARIELCTRLYGPYQTALIYDRRKDTRLPDGTLEIGKEIRKYVCGNLVEWEDIILSDNEKVIVTNVIHSTKNGKKIWTLKPIDIIPLSNIDFKTEINNALNNQNKPDQ